MFVRRFIALVVGGVLLSLGALAHASPPDPDWLGGLWDNGDYDDIILLVTSGVGAADSHSTDDDARPIVIASPLVAPPDANRPPARPLFESPTRVSAGAGDPSACP
jgi:hypothetical protein